MSSLSIFFVFPCFRSALSWQSFWVSERKVAIFGSIPFLRFFTAFPEQLWAQAVLWIRTQFILIQDFNCARIRVEVHVFSDKKMLNPYFASYFFPGSGLTFGSNPDPRIYYTWVKRGDSVFTWAIYLKGRVCVCVRKKENTTEREVQEEKWGEALFRIHSGLWK